MSAMPAVLPAATRRPRVSNVAPPLAGDSEIVIESAAVRTGIEELFLRCTRATGSNGYMDLDDLLSFLKSSDVSVAWSKSRLVDVLERCPRLVLISDGLVVWTGEPGQSLLLQRLRTMIAVRLSKLSAIAALRQLQRGNDRFAQISDLQISEIANALQEFRSIDGAIVRSGGFDLQADDVLAGDELRIFKTLKKTVFALSAETINRKLGRRPPALKTIAPILAESPVITDVDGGYRSIMEGPMQLSISFDSAVPLT